MTDWREALAWRWVLIGVIVVVAVRLPYLTGTAGLDEAGFLMVGAQWADGDSLYGNYWVDRPPLLIAIHQLASATGGLASLRLMGAVAAALCVVLAGTIGAELAGRRGSVLATAAAIAMLIAPRIAVPQVGGALLALPFILGAIALTIAAVAAATSRSRILLAATAGAIAACAPLIKQNFVDAFIGAAILIVVHVLQRSLPWKSALSIVASAAVGTSVTIAGVVGWAATRGTNPVELWHAVFPFRAEAAHVIAEYATAATTERLHHLLTVLLLSGIGAGALAIVVFAFRPITPISMAAVAMLAWAAFSVLAGGSYWMHYLLQFLPGIVFGVMAAVLHQGRRIKIVATLVAYGLIVASVNQIIHLTSDQEPTAREQFISWFREITEPGDTAILAWGQPAVLYEAGLESPYEHLWSLPVRVQDRDLVEFRRVLASDEAPTFIVASGKTINSWAINPEAAQAVIGREYRHVAYVCGYSVFLQRADDRTMPDVTDPCAKPN